MARHLHRARRRLALILCLVGLVSVGLPAPASEPTVEGTWRGLVVTPDSRCSPYNSRDYTYPRSVEAEIVAELGAIYSPYTGQVFTSTRQTDIEHIVARSEAHDSGLCAADLAVRRRFASDLLNLTLADPDINRYVKRDHDATLWMPPMNRCWFANRVIEVRRKYSHTIDRLEANALDNVLEFCITTDLVVNLGRPATLKLPLITPPSVVDALGSWDDNRNGRITRTEARWHGTAPVPFTHPAYPFMRDGDGVVCE